MNNFDLDATVAAIGLLKTKMNQVVHGPVTPWAMLLHAQERLERELRDYLVPTKEEARAVSPF